jgi:nucleoid DNA-binding protein
MKNKIMETLVKETGISKTIIELIYKEYWKVVKQIMKEMPDTLTDEDKTAITLVNLGSFYVTPEKYNNRKRI